MKNTIRSVSIAPLMLFLATSIGLMGQAPSVVSVSPNSGTGTNATFQFVFQDSAGYSSITGLDVDFGTGTTNTCYIAYQAGYIFLADNSGTSLTPLPLSSSGNSGTLSNSQCTLNVAASSISGSGIDLTLNLAINFSASYSGPHTIYALAIASALNSGWATPGTYTVSYGPPSTLSVTPSSGAGATQSFQFQFSDPGGVANIAALYADLGVTAVNTCYVTYQVGMLYLAADNGFFGSPLPIGGSGTLANSQCSINVGSSSISGSGTNVTLTLAVTFSVAYSGPHTNYAVAYNNEGLNSGWQDVGTWWAGTVMTSLNLSDFQTCIGPYGTANTCTLAPGTYPVYGYATLNIGRGGTSTSPLVIVTGGGGPGDTTLMRKSSTLEEIMGLGGNATTVTGVTIRDFTFDGNRYDPSLGANLSCLPGNSGYWDLDLNEPSGSGPTGQFTLEWLDFINAPATALLLGGAGSTVSLSNVGQGGTGYGPGGVSGTETAAQTATRSAGISITDGTGAWYNAISYAGTAGLALSGLSGAPQYAYGNLLFQNRYELSDWATPNPLCPSGGCLQQGGQLFVGGTNVSIAGNVIIGHSWPPLQPLPYPAQATGCPWGTGTAFNAGVEAYGFGHRFYNNEINTNTGSGMALAGSNPTGDITISSANPWNLSDTTRSIEGNSSGGIVFLGPNTNSSFILSSGGGDLG